MEIDRTSAARPQRILPTEPSPEPSTASPVASERAAAESRRIRVEDRIELSAAAREAGTEPNAAREARLAALRAQIDAGTYRMDANGVARRIVARQDI